MLAHIRPALVMIAVFTILTGLVYPLAVTGVAQLALNGQANGSLVRGGGTGGTGTAVVGSELIAQGFARPGYLHPRPSAAGNGYDPTASGGSNYGPLDPKLADRVKGDAAKISAEIQQDGAPGAAIPADAVTASASGLDPDVSPENAALQAPRIAAARGVAAAQVRSLIDGLTQGRTLGVLGEPRVNVLAVNRALDARFPPHRS